MPPYKGINPHDWRKAVVEECDCCHDEFGLFGIKIVGRQFLCEACRLKTWGYALSLDNSGTNSNDLNGGWTNQNSTPKPQRTKTNEH